MSNKWQHMTDIHILLNNRTTLNYLARNNCISNYVSDQVENSIMIPVNNFIMDSAMNAIWRTIYDK
jgi:hypothetical protein